MSRLQLTDKEVRQLLRNHVSRVGTQQALANEIGISHNFLSMVIRGIRPLSTKVLNYLRLKREIRYVEKIPRDHD
jgi:hypothetical protein